jgi:nucleoside-diphosphate-sugar epimerase
MGSSVALRPKLASENATPVSDYGRSKLAGEHELSAALSGRIPYTILRPASVYGPRDMDIFLFFKLVNFGLRPKTSKDRFIQLLFVDDLTLAVENSISLPVAKNKTYCLGEPAWRTWQNIGEIISISNNIKTREIFVPDWAFSVVSFFAERLARLRGKAAVLNGQKITEMRQPYWIADVLPAINELGMDFTNLSRGAKITYQWYKRNKWL